MTHAIEIDIEALLHFFDESPPESQGHATGIVAIAGEDLGAGLLAHHLEAQGASVEVLPGPCSQGTKRGKRLDRWLRVRQNGGTVYYQVEIKNWSAHALGGRVLKIDASAEELSEHKKERWSKEWDGTGFRKPTMAKVLIPMRPPEQDCLVEPLACYWDAMHPDGEEAPLFSVPVPDSVFPRVWVFSMSTYLRVLLASGRTHMQIDMPETAIRLDWLNQLFR
jgi:hypothetical protein